MYIQDNYEFTSNVRLLGQLKKKILILTNFNIFPKIIILL